jgi:hypothetical protein
MARPLRIEYEGAAKALYITSPAGETQGKMSFSTMLIGLGSSKYLVLLSSDLGGYATRTA